MPITHADLDFLISERGKHLLARLANADLSDPNTLALITSLRKTYARDEASAGLQLARLRERARDKFGADAAQMLFTDDALQQASDPRIRRYRAQSVDTSRVKQVWDVGCGIGSDSIAFARYTGLPVHGVDIDPLRVAMAQHNAQALGIEATFTAADAHDIQPPDDALVFYDPARRDAQGKRLYDVEQYLPPLSLITQWQTAQQQRQPRQIVKLSPGVDVAQLEQYGGGVEFISVGGDLKEALLQRGAGWSGLRATLIDDAGNVHHWQREGEEPSARIAEPRGWLVEPDAALLRANLVQDVTVAHDGAMLDATIAYFTTDDEPQSVWLRAWRILGWMPFHLKRLRAYLREHNVGTLTVKKRGSPITPAELIRKLGVNGTESRTLVLTRYQEQPIVLICDDIAVQ